MQSFPCNSAEHFAQLHFLISNFLSSMAIWRFRFDHFRFQKYSRFTKSLKSKLKVMHQSFETPASPHSGLSGAFTFYPSESEWSLRSPGTTVSGAFPRPYCWTHTCGTPFVKQLTNGAHGLKDTVGSHEVKTLIFERPANKLQRLLNAQGMSTCLYCRSSFIDTPGKIDNETQQTISKVVLIA